MGTDRYDIDHPCPCGVGTINVEQESPDHMWARPSQTTYTAKLNCDVCAETYSVVQSWGMGQPYLALKSEVDARANAKADYWSLDKKFRQHEAATRLEPALIAEIDAALAKSMAAAHRVLSSYGLTHDSIVSYRKNPVNGAKAVSAASGYTMAQIGETQGLTEEHRAACTKVRRRLDELHAASHQSIKPVPTGHKWLKA